MNNEHCLLLKTVICKLFGDIMQQRLPVMCYVIFTSENRTFYFGDIVATCLWAIKGCLEADVFTVIYKKSMLHALHKPNHFIW